MIGSDEVITVPTTVLPSTVTSPTSDIPEQTTDEDFNDETTANVYGNLQVVCRDFGVQEFQNYRGYM